MAAGSPDPVAIVTGAATGIGDAIAQRLRRDGATVVGFDLSGRPAVDVRDERSVASATARVLDEHGRIDVLVNNAGIYPHTPFDELDLAEWRRVLETCGSTTSSRFIAMCSSRRTTVA